MNVSLLNNTSRVEVPYIKVVIGDYTFGVFSKTASGNKTSNGFYTAANITYPNYIQSLQITKINGQVNQYVLNITYPIKTGDDPNFFEKVFSSVSQTRKIVFSYGDMALPSFTYRDEEALITTITSSFDIKSSIISYTINAVSSAALATSGAYTFINSTPKKPSDEIKSILYNKEYGLQEIFYGMNDKALVNQKGLIAGDDKVVQLDTKTNISPLEYVKYLVSCMIPASANSASVQQSDIYIMSIVDDVSDVFHGPYFKITRTSSSTQESTAYDIDIGYPTANIVTEFTIQNNENYSIYYDWQSKLSQEQYVQRIGIDGKWTQEFAPAISSGNDQYKTKTSDKTWWTKITEYPISAIVTIKGLLRPAILMTNVRLKVWFWGSLHISSGLYIVTKQVDTIDSNGYRTQLTLTRIGADNTHSTASTSYGGSSSLGSKIQMTNIVN